MGLIGQNLQERCAGGQCSWFSRCCILFSQWLMVSPTSLLARVASAVTVTCTCTKASSVLAISGVELVAYGGASVFRFPLRSLIFEVTRDSMD